MIYLGFSNTVDYEIKWDETHFLQFIEKTGIKNAEIKRIESIEGEKDLASSILYHMKKGLGCGMTVEDPQIIETYIAGSKYQVTLGGSNIRAAEVISALGGKSVVHLVSRNRDTEDLMPEHVAIMGGEQFQCCYPHIVIQYPRAIHIAVNDIDFVTPRENRVIYSADKACAEMPISESFIEAVKEQDVVLLSGFDMIRRDEILKERVEQIKNVLCSKNNLSIYMEHAWFANSWQEELLLNELGKYVRFYGMNEEEFQQIIGRNIDILNVKEVADGLKDLKNKLPETTFVIHTEKWGIAYGKDAKMCKDALFSGMITATTRYCNGMVNATLCEKIALLKEDKQATVFAEKISELLKNICCIPIKKVTVNIPTTIGLGDSFVGGFLNQYEKMEG